MSEALEIADNKEIHFTICRLTTNEEYSYYIALSSSATSMYLSVKGEIAYFTTLEEFLFISYDACINQIEKYFTIISETETPKLYLEIEAHR